MSQDSVVEIIQPKSVPPKPGKRSRKFWVLVGAVVFIALTMPRSSTSFAAGGRGKGHRCSSAESFDRDSMLSGQTEAYTNAPIFAQTSGYLKNWYFDIGAKVEVGDVLAEIDTPEVDQELAQAQAQLKVARAALHLEVLQLCSHPVIGWQDAPPGIFGLRFIQVAAI
jgi:multidrug efflux pump subunit AcrA (membrane-fusion protein)